MADMLSVPYSVFVQALDMANYERAPHYIVRESSSWLITPERPTADRIVTIVRPQARGAAIRTTAERIGL